MFRLISELAGKCGQLRSVFKPIEKALWNTGKPDLRTDKCAGENAASLILPAAVESVQHRRLEVPGKAGGQVISSRKLVIDRAGHSVNDGHFPSGLDLDACIKAASAM